MLTYAMEHRGRQSKYAYLAASIKQDILSGALKAGTRLPAKRPLAAHLGISVVTVEAAYGQLLDEGYLEARNRSGFYVNPLCLPTAHPAAEIRSGERSLPADASGQSALCSPPAPSASPDASTPVSSASLDASAPVSSASLDASAPVSSASLDASVPDASASLDTSALDASASLDASMLDASAHSPAIPPDFPITPFLRIVRDVLNDYQDQLLQRPPNAGIPELRMAISDYLKRYRGMKAKPEQIIIGSGSEYLYGFVAQLFDRQVIYGIEGQSYEKIRLVYSAYARPYELLPMDRFGVSSEGLKHSRALVLHVTPFHSYPTGITAPAGKRYEYLAWAKERGAFLVEDDFESEFSVQRKPLETMYAMDQTDSVIYLNTFTRSIAPSMRVGYMVLPERLLPRYRQKLGFYSCTVPSLDQYVLAEYIAQGHFEKRLNHIRRLQHQT